MAANQLPQFHFDDKEKMIQLKRPEQPIHWGVVVNFFLGVLGAFGTYWYTTTVLGWAGDVFTVAVAIFGGFVLSFVIMSIIALSIAYKFGYRGDWTLTAMILYVLATLLIAFFVWKLLLP